MVRAAFFDEKGVKKGAWSKEEDEKLRDYITRYGHWNWRELPKFAGLSRCGKSCRLRWMNYLRPDLKHGNFTKQEDELIFQLYQQLGTKWSTIASKMPGRTDNEIKNYWHAHLKKRVGWTAAKNDITSPSSTSSSSQPQYHSDSTRTSEIEEILEADLMGTPSSSSPAINMMVFSPPILESSPLSPAAGSSWKDEYYKEDGGGLFGRPAGTSLHKEEQQVVVKSDNYYSNNSGGGGGDFWSEPFLVDDDNSDVHRPPYDFSWVMSEDVCFQQQFDDDVESLMYRVMQELPDTTTTTTN